MWYQESDKIRSLPEEEVVILVISAVVFVPLVISLILWLLNLERRAKKKRDKHLP